MKMSKLDRMFFEALFFPLNVLRVVLAPKTLKVVFIFTKAMLTSYGGQKGIELTPKNVYKTIRGIIGTIFGFYIEMPLGYATELYKRANNMRVDD